MSEPATLKRTLSLPMMILYGLGTTISAGIYALVGEIAGVAGYYAPLPFLIASLIAGFTGEEVKEVQRNLPAAIRWTLGITTLLYLLLMVVAILLLPPADLAGSEAPLARIYETHTGKEATVVSAIGMVAILNGALIQLIMASRVFYGLGSRGQLPALLAVVHPRTRTPLFATGLAVSVVLVLALIGHLATLAATTTVIMLSIFALVNLALWRIKRREPHPAMVRTFPAWVPIVGFLISAGFVLWVVR